MQTELQRAQAILQAHIETMKAQRELYQAQAAWAGDLIRLMQYKEGVYEKPANKLYAVPKQ